MAHKNIDKTYAIKIGNGKKEVIEFVDVDCPFCRRVEDFFKDADVTRYVFLYPLDVYHPESATKSTHILCSKNPADEFQKVIRGKLVEINTCKDGEDMLKIHRAYGHKMGVSGTPAFWIDGVNVNGADPKILELIK